MTLTLSNDMHACHVTNADRHMNIPNTVFAKTASVVTGLALVLTMTAAMPVKAQTTSVQAQIQALLAQIAILQAQLNGGTTSPVITISRDLTIGSTGADVTTLQNWLITRGYAIPAGATGYFGAQTQSALARYQAANGISPAAGYFGPITRSHIAAVVPPVVVVPPVDRDDDDELSGGEANLTNFDLRSEDFDGSEGENEVEVFTAEFDVDDGDVRVERMDIMVRAEDSGMSENPWDYFDRVILMNDDGDEIGDMDVDSRSDWDEQNDDEYRLTLTGLDYVVREGDMAEITVAFDIADNIDSSDINQEFEFWIEDDGIRAADSLGIQQYIGNDNDTVSFGFSEENTGDITIRSSSDDPDASILVADEDDESDEYLVFAFEIDNQEDVEVLLTDLMIDVTTGSGDADDLIRRATLVLDGDEFDGDINASGIEFEDIDFELGEDEEITAELMITLVRDAANTTISFDIDSADLEAEGLESGDDSDVGGSADSATHTIALAGIGINALSTSQAVVTPGSNASATYGTYTLRFEVEAFDEDAYIATTADTSGTVGVTYSINGNAFSGSQTEYLTSTASIEDGFYRIDEGDSERFTLTVTLDPSTAGTFSVELDSVRFNDEDSFTGSTVFMIDGGNQDYETDPVYIAN